MKFSETWLREWVDPDVDRNTLLEQLTMAGLEVESVESVGGGCSGVVVGKVTQASKHPDADKLSVCQVFDGKDTFQVVCGAPNVREGLVSAFARVGAVLPGDFEIKKAKLRGVESQGMLCSAAELNLGEDADGILEFEDELGDKLGSDLTTALALDDVTIDLDLTPNRGDCLSVRGLAREIGVLNDLVVNHQGTAPTDATIETTFEVELEDPAGCPRYLGRVIEGIDIRARTPFWLTERLRRCGLRSIDPVVDDQRGCPTPADAVAACVMAICGQIVDDDFDGWGTYHFCGRPPVTWFQFAEAVLAGRGGKGGQAGSRLTPVATADMPRRAPRPPCSVLDCSRIREAFAIDQPDWRDGLDRMLEQIEDATLVEPTA